ncbi:RNA 2'-phosphotransferase [Allosphingosinicella deserti]|uniref:Probable RNA 2'-phosphotransferase n=1 Tax=Allosphingosinicella deserti TaxID=2116704 RepID=A0A2P7QFF3_9SPHN|nr:RNA 2'-phosphotransferase [Sphingomonas deserti]PSJ36655.1 RNA--NAD 2'-phosphotransferase [Sphingomonas deserti]
MTKQISKFLSLLLRHQPERAGLTLDPQGWVPTGAVVAALRSRFGTFSREDLERLVAGSDKQRFAFDESGERIRANQGHSVSVDLGLDAAAPPTILFHGTSRRFLGSILEQGLIKSRRQYVHLSHHVETAEKVARRRAGETVILEIASRRMAAEGYVFFRSANGVWLTDSVPPCFLAILSDPR